MDFIFDNIYIIAVAAAGLAQWWKSTQEAKKERENTYRPEEYHPENYEEFLDQAERRHARPAVPPPLPPSGPPPQPSFERNTPPPLKKQQPAASVGTTVFNAAQQVAAVEAELLRQAAIADQIRELKESKKKKSEATQAANREKAAAASAGFSGSVRDRLKNPLEIRNAFVLKEILDKPISLR